MSQSKVQANPPATSGDVIRQVVVLAATLATIIFNSLSQIIPIGGQTSADVSNKYTTFFTPANYAFAIWGVIYLLTLGFGVYQALPSQRTNPNARKAGWLYVAVCIFNCVWITLFQYDQILISLGVIILFLLSLIAIYVRLDIGHTHVSSGDHWLIHLPISVYMGWLCVATIANVSVLGVQQNWGNLLGIAAPTWAAIMLVVATVVGVIIAVTRRDVGFVAVFLWAFTAIVNKQSATPIVANTALIMDAVLVVVLVGSLILSSRRPQSLAPSHA